ncbi:Protein CBG02655 [Caenorhabditis briggsae]|uniref:Protein CBG02655 n=1 Tax=Caenorhabditis briggsae TaxID=6238 RepID=A8WTT8_CAEBR|nr:Protein CBG02655 [Caenorhabditis briggsae]CAP23900.1 Protein CBG02655 [Caenorhabditis briggsae]
MTSFQGSWDGPKGWKGSDPSTKTTDVSTRQISPEPVPNGKGGLDVGCWKELGAAQFQEALDALLITISSFFLIDVIEVKKVLKGLRSPLSLELDCRVSGPFENFGCYETDPD